MRSIEVFLRAWDNYLLDAKIAFVLGFDGKEDLFARHPKKFNSLKGVDKHFSYIKSLVKRFFERNPSVHRNCGLSEDIEIYNKYVGPCPHLLRPFRLGREEPSPPRLHLLHPLEGWQDVLLLIKGRSTANSRNIATLLLLELTNQWKDYQDLVLALARREEAIQAASKDDGTVSKETPKSALGGLKLVRNESTAYWRDRFLSINGRHFNILCKFAQNPGKVVVHKDLYDLINSQYHKDLLLRQYISDIRSAFPLPYSDPHHPESIVKTRKMEGYYLDLPPEQVEII